VCILQHQTPSADAVWFSHSVNLLLCLETHDIHPSTVVSVLGGSHMALRVRVCLQADVALMPFFERFRLCLQLTQGYDLASVGGGAVTRWLVSNPRSTTTQHAVAATNVVCHWWTIQLL
jgi:hypothetical protein